MRLRITNNVELSRGPERGLARRARQRWCVSMVVALVVFGSGWGGVSSRSAEAGVVFYSSQSAFDHAGTILQTANFDDFGPGFHAVADPFSRGGISLTSIRVIGANTVASNGTPPLIWNPIRPMPLFPFSATIYGSIDVAPTAYNMFGFQAGYFE